MNNGYAICFNEWIADERIKNELRLLLKISSLTADKGYCFASNEYFAEYFKSSIPTISRQIKNLEKFGYLNITYKMSGNVVISRDIRLSKMNTAVIKNDNGAVIKNDKDNITSINITSNNKEKINKKDFGLAETFIEEKNVTDLSNQEIIKDFVEYRKEIKKPLKTIAPIQAFVNALIELKDLGYSFDYCIEQMKSNEWQTLKVDYIHKPVKQNNFNQPKSKVQKTNEFIDDFFERMAGQRKDYAIDVEVLS